MKDVIELKKLEDLDAEIEAPPSKSMTHRAIFAAALAEGTSTLRKPLMAEDTTFSLDAIRTLGVRFQHKKEEIHIEGSNGRLLPQMKELFVGNSGTTMRLVTGVASLIEKGELIIKGNPRMHERPLKELIDALNHLGVDITSLEKPGYPPILIRGGGIKGGSTELSGNVSSQFFSALLLSGTKAKKQVEIKPVGELKSRPYIDMTIEVLREFGAEITNQDYERFVIPPNQQLNGRSYQIEGDYSSASYFFALAAILPGKIRVKNLNRNSQQGDAEFLKILEKMGCQIQFGLDYVEVVGKDLEGISIDMKNVPDLVPTMAVLGAFAEGKTQIQNVEHLRYKESDRLSSLATELKKIGALVEEERDGLTISKGEVKSAEIETYDDHRITMSFAIAGLKTGKLKIRDPQNVAKSFPDFFQLIQRITNS